MVQRGLVWLCFVKPPSEGTVSSFHPALVMVKVAYSLEHDGRSGEGVRPFPHLPGSGQELTCTLQKTPFLHSPVSGIWRDVDMDEKGEGLGRLWFRGGGLMHFVSTLSKTPLPSIHPFAYLS